MEPKQLEQKAEMKSSDKAKERLKKDLTPGTAVATVPQPEPEVSRQEQPQDKQAQTKPPRQSILKKLLYAIRRIYGKITAIGRGLFSLVVKLLHMPEKASETIGTLTDFWNLEENVKARESIWRELKFLWKHSRPRKADLTLHFGFEDPASTGTCLGLLSLLYPLYTDHICLYPDFEHQIFKGETFIKGRIRSFIFVKTFLTLALDKGVRRVLQSFKRI